MHTLKVYSGFIIILVASFLLCSMKDPFRNQNDILLFQNLRNDSILIDTSEQSLNNFFKAVYFPELLDGYSSYFIQCVKRNNNGFWQILIGGRKSDGSFKTQFNLWGNDSSIEDETFYAVKSNSGDCIAYFVIDWNAIPNDYCFYWEDNPNGNFSECCYQLQGNSVISHNIAVLAHLSNYLYVMKEGRIVEEGTTDQLIAHPSHPYTQMLMDAVPRFGGKQ